MQADKMEELTRALDALGANAETENKQSPDKRLAKSFKTDSELMAFIKKESSLAGWSDSIAPGSVRRPSIEHPKRETVRVTGFNIVESSPSMSPLIPPMEATPPDKTIVLGTKGGNKQRENKAGYSAEKAAGVAKDNDAMGVSAGRASSGRESGLGMGAGDAAGAGLGVVGAGARDQQAAKDKQAKNQLQGQESSGGGGGVQKAQRSNKQNKQNKQQHNKQKNQQNKNQQNKNQQSKQKQQNKQKQQKEQKQQKQQKQKAHKAGKSAGQRSVSMQYDDPKRLAKFNKHRVLDRTSVEKQKRVPLFSHLPQYEGHHAVSLQVGLGKTEIHPAILRLGVKFAEGVIVGSNARCMAMLTALKEAIQDFNGNEEKETKRDLMDMLKPIIRFVAVDCRPMSPGMGNAIRYIKNAINNLPTSKTFGQCKAILLEKIDSFAYERIEVADQVISQSGARRISDGDVIMTYACSRVVEMLFVRAYEEKKKFRVIIVDSRPRYEGKTLCKRLVSKGINCTYILLNGLSYAMKEVTRVMVGAASILANGAVLSRVGTAVVGMMANVYNVPVIVCCETYKFHERVQVSSISFNELGDPEDLVTIDKDNQWRSRGAGGSGSGSGKAEQPTLASWRKTKNLKLLNLVYDLTPAHFISMVITEVGQIPVTSVPVVLREYMKYSTT